MTELTVFIADAEDDAAELHSLYSAILEDDDLRRARKSLVTGQPREGEMGVEDIIRLVLDPDLFSAVASCLTAWFTARSSRLRVVIQGPSGSAEIEAEGRNVANEETLERALNAAVWGVDDEAAR